MTPVVLALPTLEALQKYVHTVLCEHDCLDMETSPIFQALIKRRERVCGLFFQVNGPRSVKVYAVWAGEEDRILFYDAAGQRFAETKLSDAPDPATVGHQVPAKKAA